MTVFHTKTHSGFPEAGSLVGAIFGRVKVLRHDISNPTVLGAEVSIPGRFSPERVEVNDAFGSLMTVALVEWEQAMGSISNSALRGHCVI